MEVFEEQWTEYEKKFKRRLEATKRNPSDVKQEVWEMFRTVLSRHRHDKEMLAVVSRTSLQRQSKLDDSKSQFIDSNNEQWFDRYLEIKPANIIRRDRFVSTQLSAKDIIRDVVRKMKETVLSFVDKVYRDLSVSAKFDGAVVAEIVFSARDIAADIEGRRINEFHKN